MIHRRPCARARPRAPLSPVAGSLLCAVLAAGSGAAQGGPTPPPEPEPVLPVNLLLNGDFAEPRNPAIAGIPWWRVPAGAARPALVEREGGGFELLTAAEGRSLERLEQPVPAYGPLVEQMVLRGRVRGSGRLELRDSTGRVWGRSFASEGDLAFEIGGAEIAAELGAPPVPRLLLSISADPQAGPGASAAWSGLELWVPLPCPSEEALRAELLEHLRWIFGTFLDGGLDDLGPEPSALWCKIHDAQTGEVLTVLDRVHGDPIYAELLRAWCVEPDAAWQAALERYVADWLERCLHPETGLPRFWNPVTDQPLDREYVEIHWTLRQLLDLHEHGPPAVAEPCLAAARRIGEAVLARGVLPDDGVAAKYRPSDGAASTAVPEIRYLDVAAQLARLGALDGDERYLQAARGAVLALEYTHSWPGDWRAIDPGFDDTYGHIGQRSMVMWRATGDEVLGRLASSGYRTYAPLLRDALRYGGNVAADQVRCWKILAELARLEPAWRDEVSALLAAAAHSHFKGEQGEEGAWIDVTMAGFDPKANLGVGDIPGLPTNLIEGLASAYDAELGLATDELRALFTTALRSSIETYRHPHGLRSQRRAAAGPGAANPAVGSIRLLAGLVEMLEKLSP